MLRVTADDGMVFEGADEKAVVRQMRNTQWNAPEAKRDYICEVIDRVEQVTQTVCAHADGRVVAAKEFLDYLASVGFVQIESVGEPVNNS